MEFFKGFLLRKEFVSNQPTEKGGGGNERTKNSMNISEKLSGSDRTGSAIVCATPDSQNSVTIEITTLATLCGMPPESRLSLPIFRVPRFCLPSFLGVLSCGFGLEKSGGRWRA